MGEDSFISLTEVTEAVKKLSSGKVPGVDEISSEMLKAFLMTVTYGHELWEVTKRTTSWTQEEEGHTKTPRTAC